MGSGRGLKEQLLDVLAILLFGLFCVGFLVVSWGLLMNLTGDYADSFFHSWLIHITTTGRSAHDITVRFYLTVSLVGLGGAWGWHRVRRRLRDADSSRTNE